MYICIFIYIYDSIISLHLIFFSLTWTMFVNRLLTSSTFPASKSDLGQKHLEESSEVFRKFPKLAMSL